MLKRGFHCTSVMEIRELARIWWQRFQPEGDMRMQRVWERKAPQTWFLNALCAATDWADSFLAVSDWKHSRLLLLPPLTQVDFHWRCYHNT